MSFQGFPFNFPQGPIVVPSTGQLSPGPNGYYFMLSLFNRSGGTDGIVPVVKTGLTATGQNNQANALALGADWNQVTSAPSAGPTGPFSGVIVPSMSPGNDIWIWNADTAANDTLNVYPFSGAAIGSGAANAAYALGPGLLAYFQCWSTTLIIPIIKVNPLTL